MGFLSLFRKDKPAVDDEAPAHPADSELERHREDARAIVLKIDAIEAAMAADMFGEPAFRRPPQRAASPCASDFAGGAVTELLAETGMPAEAIAAENAPAIEEAACLYADGRPAEACRVLAAAVALRPARDRTAWWMLFDLYGLLDRREAFDSLAIDYASTFETPPPPWNPLLADDTDIPAGPMPTFAFAGMLDASAGAQISRLVADGAAALRMDFSRVAGVEPAGCALLHDALREVGQGRALILAGAEELLARVRASVDVGRRDGGEAPWLLMLELLRLLNREKEYDEAGMDYRVTFDAAPPPFAPPGSVASVPPQASAPAVDRFLLPRTIEGDAVDVRAAIRAHAEPSTIVVFDCSRLARIDRAAAGELLDVLRELAGGARRIEFREVNHMVAALLRLHGAAGVARLVPHRY